MSAPVVAAWMTIRRIQQDEQERLDSLTTNTTNTTTTNKVTVQVDPKPQVSRFAQWSFYLIFFALGSLLAAFGFVAAGIVTAVVTSLALCGFALFTSISLGILSLRENL